MHDIFFTSDTHFSHLGIIKHCNRPYSGIKDMNEDLLQRWNARVKKDDVVYHLGDFGWSSSKDENYRIFNALNGQKHLIVGNHDSAAILQLPWASVQDYLRLNLSNCPPIILFHYPIYEWDQMHRNSIHLYGHVHAQTQSGLSGTRSMDVGVDAVGDYAPISLGAILLYMQEKSNVTY